MNHMGFLRISQTYKTKKSSAVTPSDESNTKLGSEDDEKTESESVSKVSSKISSNGTSEGISVKITRSGLSDFF